MVNEINPSLGMGPQIYPAHGERRDVVSEFLDHYFPGTSRLPHSEHWHFSLNSVVRQFTSETLDRATLKAMPILKNPQWRSFELVATHPEVTQSRSVAMRSLNASKVHGAIISDSTGRTIVQFVADGTAADAAGAALARALRPLKIRVRETSQEPFKVSPGFSVG